MLYKKLEDNRLYHIVLIVIILFFSAGVLFGGKNPDVYFRNSINAFLDEDYKESTGLMEIALSFEPGNKKLKIFLSKILVESALHYYAVKEHKESIVCAKMAREINFSSRKAHEFYALLNPGKELKAGAKELPVKGKVLEGEEEEQEKGEEESAYEKYRKLLVVVNELDEKQLRRLSVDSEERDLYEKLMGKCDERRQKDLEALKMDSLKFVEQKEKTRKRLMERKKLYISRGFIKTVTAIIITGLLIGGLYLVFLYVKKRIETIKGEKENVLSRQFKRDEALVRGKAKLKESGELKIKDKITIREMIGDENPLIRIAGINALSGKVKDARPVIAGRILRPLLKDEDIHARAHAAGAMFKYNEGLSMRKLKKMSGNSSLELRVIVAWTLGEVKCARGIGILEGLVEDIDKRVVRISLNALRKIEKSKDDGLSESNRMKVTEILNEYTKQELDMEGLKKEVEKRKKGEIKHMPSMTRNMLKKIRKIKDGINKSDINI